MNEVFVSIICLAYNHEKYIRDALESFVKQKTKYKFEVLIHDDASTDETKAIIIEYAKLYPEIIKPIFEEENQYSKFHKLGQGGITQNILFPLAKGKYLCFCEGDDFFVDDNMIEQKVEFLEKHPEYCAYLHRTHFFDCKKNSYIGYSNPSNVAYDFTLKDALLMYSHTTGWMIRKDLYLENKGAKFDCIKKFTDQCFGIYTSLFGKVRYTPDVMSVWRKNTEGSWTQRTFESTKKNMKSFHKKRIRFLTYMKSISKEDDFYMLDRMILLQKIHLYKLSNRFISILFCKIIFKIKYRGIK